MKILTYIFAAVWALLAFNFLIIDSYYIAGSLSMFFGLICISLISDFKKYETSGVVGLKQVGRGLSKSLEPRRKVTGCFRSFRSWCLRKGIHKNALWNSCSNLI